jgi:hypothetical protein
MTTTEQEWWQRLADGLGVLLEADHRQIFDEIVRQVQIVDPITERAPIAEGAFDLRTLCRMAEQLANRAVSAAAQGLLDDHLAAESSAESDHEAAFAIVMEMTAMDFSAVGMIDDEVTRVTFRPVADIVWAAMRRGYPKA